MEGHRLSPHSYCFTGALEGFFTFFLFFLFLGLPWLLIGPSDCDNLAARCFEPGTSVILPRLGFQGLSKCFCLTMRRTKNQSSI